MPNVIQQSVVLPAAAELLFETYLDPQRHAAVTGAPVTIGREAGDEFRAFGDQLWGKILAVVSPRLIVQSWRSVNFNDADPDSTLILTFTPEGSSGRIDLVHVDVPDQDFEAAREGWEKYYWTPWRAFLAGN